MRRLRLALLSCAALISACATTIPRAHVPFAPVYEENFPDPFIVPFEGRYLAYATNANDFAANVQMAESKDLLNWRPLRHGERLHDAMPVLPTWAQAGWTWAPEVIRLGERYYVLYFTARERASGRQCTGVAVSDDPRGPFVSSAPEPLVCQRDLGGTIDASPFLDEDGSLYLYYKADANAIGAPTEIFVQRLTSDGLQLTGAPVALLTNDKEWEAHVIESPTMVRREDAYVLFFSANHFGWEPHQRLSPYAMGYARCAGPMGPCEDAPNNPILHSYHDPVAGCLSGPGHQAVFEAMGRQYVVFHAHAARADCQSADIGRYMYVAPLAWRGEEPVIERSLRSARRSK